MVICELLHALSFHVWSAYKGTWSVIVQAWLLEWLMARKTQRH